ncbi:MAG: Tol-Pal system beta propeller repeat protein TolB [Nitrospirae bacterium]|nr:Tol-Pal system beta propeller repeat protein TolB [Nitrospirota bacterium]
MKQTVHTWLLFLFLTVILSGISFAEDVYLETTKGEAEKIPVTIVLKGDDHELIAEIKGILEADLERSSYFNLVKNDGIDIDVSASKLNEKAGGQVGSLSVESLIVAMILREDRVIKMDGKLFETGGGELIFSKRYVGNNNLIRRLAHRFADEIVFRLTGEKGIAQSRIVYLSDRTGQKELYIMDYDGSSSKMITGNKSLNLSPSWSPDGRLIAYTSYRDGNPDIYVVDLTTSMRWRVTDYQGLDISPAWSPDGKRLAYASSRDGNSEIYTSDKEGKDLKRITYMRGEDVSPTWSPTGEEIAFTSDRGGSPQIYIMKTDGTNIRRLTFKGEYNSDPAWSPKGDKVAFACRRGGEFKICTIGPDGSKLREITGGGGSDESPSWSSDGKKIVFASSRSGKWNIYVMNADGSNIEKLTGKDGNNMGNNLGPDWSPN